MNAVVISEAWALNNTDLIEKYLIQSVYQEDFNTIFYAIIKHDQERIFLNSFIPVVVSWSLC